MGTREFNLQPALSYKERLEDICQMALAEIEAAYAREYQVLEMLRELEKLGYQELERQHVMGKLDMGAINVHFGDLQALQRRIHQQMVVLDDLGQKAESKREELIEISKERKALEKLKEKHQKKVAQATVRAENKFMEDIATAQFLRRRLDS